MEYMADILARQDGETDAAYKVRVLLTKEDRLMDADWVEIADAGIFDCGERQLRGMAKGIALARDAGVMFDNASNEQLARVYKEKQKMYDIRREVTEAYRADARSEMLRDSIITAASKMPPIKIYQPSMIRSVVEPDKLKIMVLAIADLHYGREIKIKGLMGETLNVYSPEIFENRMSKVMFQAKNIIESEKPDCLWILNLGDVIDGMLRESQLTSLRYGIVESTMYVSEYLAQWINEFSKVLPTSYMCVGGNHDEIRPLGSRRGDYPVENMGRISAWWLEERFRGNPNVGITNGENIDYVDICGNNVLCVHGADDKKAGEAAKEYSFLYGVPIDYVFRGHLHSLSIQTVGINSRGRDIREIQVPSLCGIDELSMSLKRRANAGALAMTFEVDKGATNIIPIEVA